MTKKPTSKLTGAAKKLAKAKIKAVMAPVVAIAAVVVLIAAVVGVAMFTIMHQTQAVVASSECGSDNPSGGALISTSGPIQIGTRLKMENLEMTAERMQVAAQIVSTATSPPWKTTDKAAVIAMATAMVEAKLGNPPNGDRTSVGAFQQQNFAPWTVAIPGWDVPPNRQDVRFATGKFLQQLYRVKGWEQMEPGKAAQAVQRSGFPERYAYWIEDATNVVSSLKGGSTLTTVPTIAVGQQAAGTSASSTPPSTSSNAMLAVGGSALSALKDQITTAMPGWTIDFKIAERNLNAALGEAVTSNKVSLVVAGDSKLDSATGGGGGFMLGDSVTVAAGDKLKSAGFTVEAKVGRFLKEAIPIARSRRSEMKGTVVIHLGNNYSGNQGVFAAEVDEMMSVLSGVPKVVWVTVAEDRATQSQVNAVLGGLPAKYPNVSLLDWRAQWASNRGYTGGDHLHLTGAGISAFASLVASGVGGGTLAELAKQVKSGPVVVTTPTDAATARSLASLGVTTVDPGDINAVASALNAAKARVGLAGTPAADCTPAADDAVGSASVAPGAEPGTSTIVLPAGGTTLMATTVAPRLQAMLNAAAGDGIPLGGWGYRSAASQIRLRREHCGSSDYDIYQKPSRLCKPPTATPGKSMHEVGLAIDLTYKGSTIGSHASPAWQWLNAHAAQYGFFNLASEPWHWSVNGN